MPESELKLVKRCVEFQPLEMINDVPRGTRGLYALLRFRPRLGQYDVVYVGMARRGVRARLLSHAHSKAKRDLWTHFSIFEVWDNVRSEEIEELEGLLRHIYRRDSRANRLNAQRVFSKLRRVQSKNLGEWSSTGPNRGSNGPV